MYMCMAYICDSGGAPAEGRQEVDDGSDGVARRAVWGAAHRSRGRGRRERRQAHQPTNQLSDQPLLGNGGGVTTATNEAVGEHHEAFERGVRDVRLWILQQYGEGLHAALEGGVFGLHTRDQACDHVHARVDGVFV